MIASGITAIAGFAVLALSDIQMLSDFGRVTVVDLSVSLLGVLAVLPAVLMLAERRARRAARPRRRRRRAGARRPGVSGPGPPRPPGGSSRYTWVVGVAAVLALAYITLNTLGTDAPGSRGVPNGERLPPFAVPLALSKLSGDAQVDPAEGLPGARAATCSTRASSPSAGRSRSRSSPPARSAASARSTCSSACARRFPDVAFAAVSVRGDRGEVRRTVRERGWGMPVGYDHDGAVSNAYAVAICPTITFARPRRQGGGHVVRAARRGGAGRAAWRRCGERGRPAGSTPRWRRSSPSCACTR